MDIIKGGNSAALALHAVALSAGADDFLEKPFKKKDLLQKVEKLIR